jgi:hypothetical protein
MVKLNISTAKGHLQSQVRIILNYVIHHFRATWQHVNQETNYNVSTSKIKQNTKARQFI